MTLEHPLSISAAAAARAAPRLQLALGRTALPRNRRPICEVYVPGAVPEVTGEIWKTWFMGRHSASSDEGDEAATAAVIDDAATQTGRHLRVEEAPKPSPRAGEEQLVALDEVAPEDGPLGLIAENMTEAEPVRPVADPPPAADQPAAEPAPSPPASSPPASVSVPTASTPASAQPARGNQSTAADLALLREHSAVRARVIAALVVPFVLYTAVLYLIGSLGAYVIWVWIPLVTGGVLGGFILDVEHRKRAAGPEQ
jgi:hypothetical protein